MGLGQEGLEGLVALNYPWPLLSPCILGHPKGHLCQGIPFGQGLLSDPFARKDREVPEPQEDRRSRGILAALVLLVFPDILVLPSRPVGTEVRALRVALGDLEVRLDRVSRRSQAGRDDLQL